MLFFDPSTVASKFGPVKVNDQERICADNVVSYILLKPKWRSFRPLSEKMDDSYVMDQ